MGAMLRTRIQPRMWLGVLLFAFLFVLLFQYRWLSLLKRLGEEVAPFGGKLPIVFELQNASPLLKPFLYTLDYLNTVWFTTLLGLFIAGAVTAFLPHLVQHWLAGNDWKAHLGGALFGLPNMFCSCCAVGTAAGLHRAGAGLSATLAAFVTSPSLNFVVLVLAFQLLPLPLALARLALGLIAALVVTFVIAKLAPQELRQSASLQMADDAGSAAQSVRQWLAQTWAITRAVLPVLVGGLFLIGVFKTFFSFEAIAKSLGNDALSVLLAAVVGTILMTPTFTEVLWVGEFMRQGMGTAPAVALLITLPAVSFPSLFALGRVIRSYRVAAGLGIFICGLGVIGGIIVLYA